MQPIFDEMIKMWSDLGCSAPIERHRYWLDNHFIVAFDTGGGKHKLFKYKVLDDLSVEITPHESCYGYKFETWWQTANRLSSELDILESKSLSTILTFL